MRYQHAFKFVSSELNAQVIARFRAEGVKHLVDSDGSICYANDDEETVENDILGRVRDRIFSSWQLLFCPPEWAERYQRYMTAHQVPTEEQRVDGQPCFLIPRQYRPHTWKLPQVQVAKPLLTAVPTGHKPNVARRATVG